MYISPRYLANIENKGQHEYVITTHIDKGHVHNHILFCAVNFVDHHKYNSNKRSYYGIRNMSDKLCRDNGLSVVVPQKGSKGKSYTEYQAEKTGTSWKGKLKIAVDALMELWKTLFAGRGKAFTDSQNLFDIFYAISSNTIRDGAIRHRKYCSHTVCD